MLSVSTEQIFFTYISKEPKRAIKKFAMLFGKMYHIPYRDHFYCRFLSALLKKHRAEKKDLYKKKTDLYKRKSYAIFSED